MLQGEFLRAIVSLAAPNLSDGAKMVWDWKLSVSSFPVVLLTEGEAIVDAIIARYYTPFTPALSNKLSITQIELRSYTHPADGYIASGTLWTGGNAANLLPPANTFAIQFIRSNFSMRNGRKAYPGGVIAAVDGNGGISTATVDGIRVITDGWATTSMEVEFSSETGATFDEYVITAPQTYADPVLRSQRITEYSDVYWGTQNSRK